MSGKRMSMSEMLALALTRNVGPRNEVQLYVDRDGAVKPKVTATHDDLEEAERMAMASMRRLLEAFPVQADETPLKTGLTRNAKGDTQIDVDGYGDEVVAKYDELRERYPLTNGTPAPQDTKAAASIAYAKGKQVGAAKAKS